MIHSSESGLHITPETDEGNRESCFHSQCDTGTLSDEHELFCEFHRVLAIVTT